MSADAALPSPPASTAPREFVSHRAYVVLVSVIALFAAAMTWYATRDGVGLSPDSDTYLTIARTMASVSQPGATQQPITHYPPLYPLLLAAPAKLGIPLFTAARVLNAITFAATIVLAAGIFREGLRVPRLGVLLGAALLAVSQDLLYINSMLLSDGLFIVLVLLAWLMMARFLATRDRKLLVVAAIAVALVMLTRYAGAALGLACAFALLLLGKRALRQRTIDATIFSIIAIAPIGLWIIRNIIHTGSAANRRFVYHPPTSDQWTRALITIAEWLWPISGESSMWRTLGVLAFFALLAAGSARNARAEAKARGESKPVGVGGLLVMFAILYLGFIAITVTWFDAHTPLDFRILAPAHVALLMVVFAELARSSLPPKLGLASRAWPLLLVMIAALTIGWQGVRSSIWAYWAPENYVGYSMRKWRDSDLLTFVRTIPPDALIYTNGTALLRLQTGRPVKQIPAVMDPSTLEPLPNFDARLRAMERELKARRGYVFYFGPVRRPALVTKSQLQADLKLRLIYAGLDGDVFQYRDAKKPKKKKKKKRRPTTQLVAPVAARFTASPCPLLSATGITTFPPAHLNWATATLTIPPATLAIPAGNNGLAAAKLAWAAANFVLARANIMLAGFAPQSLAGFQATASILAPPSPCRYCICSDAA
jgi:hypothetical protein